jgi:4-hydroxybenzoate polyprenyltransferase
MKKILLGLLIVIAIVMIFLCYKAGILPPALTGAGFLIIAFLMGSKQKNARERRSRKE